MVELRHLNLRSFLSQAAPQIEALFWRISQHCPSYEYLNKPQNILTQILYQDENIEAVNTT